VLNYTVNADIGHALYEPVDVNWQNIATASNKIMEYIASAIPVLASNRSDIKDLFDLYQCGLTCDESEPTQIASRINQLLASANLCERLGQNGRQAFENHFHYQKQYHCVLDLIAHYD
jgi:glycosyltransferase involved in cell wall biosynthesis